MMPMPPQGPGGPPPGGPGGAPGPNEIKSQLVMMITKAKQIAEQNGVNFDEVLKEVNSGGPKPGGEGRPPIPSGPMM